MTHDNTQNTKDRLRAYFSRVIAGKRQSATGQAKSDSPEVTETPETAEIEATEGVRFDAKGNAVWNYKAQHDDHESHDSTIDLLKSLENETLAVEETDPEHLPGADPYNSSDPIKKV